MLTKQLQKMSIDQKFHPKSSPGPALKPPMEHLSAKRTLFSQVLSQNKPPQNSIVNFCVPFLKKFLPSGLGEVSKICGWLGWPGGLPKLADLAGPDGPGRLAVGAELDRPAKLGPAQGQPRHPQTSPKSTE